MFIEHLLHTGHSSALHLLTHCPNSPLRRGHDSLPQGTRVKAETLSNVPKGTGLARGELDLDPGRLAPSPLQSPTLASGLFHLLSLGFPVC